MDKIHEAFNKYFEAFGITLPEKLPEKGDIRQKGWAITYHLNQDDDCNAYLDFFADHRMTNPRHIRILHTGETKALDI